MVTAIAPVPVCPKCETPNSAGGVFCVNCRLYLRDETGTVERVTHTRRFFGDWLIEGLLFIFTLGIGWLIWLFFTARNAQSPGKLISDVFIINVETGRAVSAGEVWLRDVVLKIIVAGVVPFGTLIDPFWILIDRDRQAIHDKIIKTVVVYAPAGLPDSMMHQASAPIVYQAPGS